MIVSRACGAAVAAAALAAGCAVSPRPVDPDAPVRWDVRIPLEGGAVTLHLSRPCTAGAAHPLIVYATGDGGWRGKDRDAYRHMIRWGYPVAGFSAPEYLKLLVHRRRAARPADVARDYARVIRAAREQLALTPAIPIILVGVSRGSGLTIAAAGQGSLTPDLAGLVTVALTREEEYVHRLRRSRRQRDPELVMLDNYTYLSRLGRLPLAIIQSTHDDYLPAEEARRLMGPDTAFRELHPIVSKNHSFSDARPALYRQMKASLAWVAHLHLAQGAGSRR